LPISPRASRIYCIIILFYTKTERFASIKEKLKVK